MRRLLRLMRLGTIYPMPRLSLASPGHQIYPYPPRGVTVARVNQVWIVDIRYIRSLGGFVYLVAIIDCRSRYALDWEISTMMESEFHAR
jgi:putative transposase